MAKKHGIDAKWGHQANEFEQSHDGLHSSTQSALFGKEKANFTGLVQAKLLLVNHCGNGRHMQSQMISIHGRQNTVKYGLYDRPELKLWFKGRIVLLGDAAHPTSPVHIWVKVPSKVSKMFAISCGF
ncbi:hypothetical protein M405DRAFT_839949 [Rhizopogon salebrosus TDB-379]|nr:hypothetical protein M405DRAFT_839949 [Rhizopogon salebrosus TDB-379]